MFSNIFQVDDEETSRDGGAGNRGRYSAKDTKILWAAFEDDDRCSMKRAEELSLKVSLDADQIFNYFKNKRKTESRKSNKDSDKPASKQV
jgi:hypothetical protein